jgi:hypothetical protein
VIAHPFAMMKLLFCIVLFCVSSRVVAGHAFDAETIYHPYFNVLSTNYTCALGDVDILAWPDRNQHGDVCGHAFEACSTNSESTAINGLWTKRPHCIQTSNERPPFCVFTDAKFAQGRGISILTDPSTAQKIFHLPAFTNPKALAGINVQADSPPFKIHKLPGRGMGVIANQTIESGDLIMAYTTTTVFHGDAFDELDDYHILHTTVNQLPKSSQARWLEMAAHFDGDSYNEKINTNAFSEDFNEKEHYVIIPEVAV